MNPSILANDYINVILYMMKQFISQNKLSFDQIDT